MSTEFTRCWIGLEPGQYAEIYDSLDTVEGAWGVFSCWTKPERRLDLSPCDQETVWAWMGRPLLRNRTTDGKHSYYIALCEEA